MNDWLDAEIRAERAQQLTDAEQWADALAELDAAIAINPNDPAWHAQRGQLLDQLDRHEEAIHAYSEALRLDPGDIDLSTLLGVDLIRTGRYQEAIDCYEQLAVAHPDYEPAYCHRIAAYTRLNEHDKAEEMFYLAQQLSDDCPNCYHHVAESLACRGLLPRAIYCWLKALDIEPDYPHARQRIAEAYRAEGQVQRAREFYLDAMRRDPGNTELIADFGDLLIETNDLDGAASKFQHVLDLDPDSARANVMLGLIASQRDKPDVAVGYFESAMLLDRAYPGLRSHLGEAELRRGNHESAMAHLCLAIEDDPDDCVALMAYGNCLLELSRPGEAAEQFEHVLELEPRMVGVHHNLAVCRFLQEDFERGIGHCLDALRIDPNHVMALHKLALAYVHLGRWTEARQAMQRGLSIDPTHSGLLGLAKRMWRMRLWHQVKHALTAGWRRSA